jgi:hypothetical protein
MKKKPHLVKGSAAAKAYMAKLRKKKGTAKKKAAPKKKATKKAAPKKRAVKKSATHKDTKSHNVNIRVVSGVKNINSFAIHQLAVLNSEMEKTRFSIDTYKKQLKHQKTATDKAYIKSQIRFCNAKLANLKKQITIVKRSIK